MSVLRRVILTFGSILAGMLFAGAAAAQDYPTRPVRMVVPFPPGAASDFLGRVLGQKLSDTWGQQFVVDNRPGAGGLIGSSSHLAAEMFSAESVKHLKTDNLRTCFQNAGADPAPSTPEEFYRVQQSEYARVRKIIQDIGLKPLI